MPRRLQTEWTLPPTSINTSSFSTTHGPAIRNFFFHRIVGQRKVLLKKAATYSECTNRFGLQGNHKVMTLLIKKESKFVCQPTQLSWQSSTFVKCKSPVQFRQLAQKKTQGLPVLFCISNKLFELFFYYSAGLFT